MQFWNTKREEMCSKMLGAVFIFHRKDRYPTCYMSFIIQQGLVQNYGTIVQKIGP